MEKTNTLGKVVGVILFIVYLAIWGLALAMFYIKGWSEQEMAFNILFIWVVMPVSGFVIALFMGRLNSFGWAKWIIPVFMGIMYMLVEYITFGMSNNALTGEVNPPEWSMIAVGGGIALLGMCVGSILRIKRAHDKAKMVEKTATRELPELEQLRNNETPEEIAKMEVIDVVPQQQAPVETGEADSDGFVEVPQDK
ncbi:MAG: hypothetical protein KBS66_04585 [Eubacterium sp.]|nr:hypothetical protein [Candidatus Colimonas fimequi]